MKETYIVMQCGVCGRTLQEWESDSDPTKFSIYVKVKPCPECLKGVGTYASDGVASAVAFLRNHADGLSIVIQSAEASHMHVDTFVYAQTLIRALAKALAEKP